MTVLADTATLTATHFGVVTLHTIGCGCAFKVSLAGIFSRLYDGSNSWNNKTERKRRKQRADDRDICLRSHGCMRSSFLPVMSEGAVRSKAGDRRE